MSNLSINSNLSDELMHRTDIKNATKTILEDICNDFENMDVITPKNKFLAFDKKGRTAEKYPEWNASKVLDVSFGREEQYLAEKTVLYNNTLPHQNDLRKKDIVDTSCIKSNGTVNALVPVKECMQQQNSALFNVDSLNSDNSVQLLNDCREPDKITLVSDSYANNKDLSSSLAELADAEIIQTGDNSVSIIITNPRLIKVMTQNSKNPEPSVATDAAKCIPNRSESISEVIVESPSVTHDVGSQEISNLKPTDASLKEKVNVVQEPERLLCAASSKAKKKISHCLRKRTFATRKGKYRTFNKITKVESIRGNMKARRISAKLKAKWAKDLEMSGRLECPMPGCCQTFVTVANFQTHYKWCTGKKDLQHCLYCDSLIFSSQKAVLHHMEVEHPDKFQEYKAKFPESDEKEISENEAKYQKIDEKIPQRLKYLKKRKFSPKSKENLLSPKSEILKHKMKSIEETAIKNIREFKKCVKFDNIVHKINSVDDVVRTAEVLHQATEIKFPKQRRRKLFLTESIVDDKKYFFDSDDERTSTESRENSAEITPIKINTKSRLVLNMERYKRYNEYLKLTRDWASERRTYSRCRSGFNSFDSSYMLALQNEEIKDTHQLNDSSTSAVSLSISENEVSNEMQTEIREFSLLESNICNSQTSSENQQCFVNDNESVVEVSQNRKSPTDALIFSLGANNTSSPKNMQVSAENNMVAVSNGSVIPPKQRVTCYSRSNLISLNCVKNEALCVRKQPLKIGNIITYGKTVPDFEKTHSQDILPVIDFDTLVKNTTFVEKKGKSVCENSPRVVKKVQNVKVSNEILKHSKEDGIKQPTAVDVPIKRKRGRPPKIRTNVTEVQGKVQDSENKASKLKGEQKHSKVRRHLKNKNRVSNIKRKVGCGKFTSVNHQRYRKVQRKSKANLRKVKLKCRSRQIRGLKRESLKKIVHCAESETQVIKKDTLTGDLTSLCLAACMKSTPENEEVPVKCSQVDDHNYSSCVSENDASLSVLQSCNKNNSVSVNEVNHDGDLPSVESVQKDIAHSENVYLQCVTNNFPENSVNHMEISIEGVDETQIQRKDSEMINNTCELIGDEYNSNPEFLKPVETQTLPLDQLPCAEEESNNELFVNCENDAKQPEPVNVSSKCSNDDCSFVDEQLISETVRSPVPTRNSSDSCVIPDLHSESDKHRSPESSELQSKSIHNCLDSSISCGVKQIVNSVLNNVHNESKECKQPSNEIKIKRPRGRPRKYPKESSIQKSSVESSSFSESVESNQNSDFSLQMQSNGNSAVFEEVNLSLLMNSTGSDKNTSPVIRKSERVKKRKHEDYVTLESKKREKNPQTLERNAVQMVAKKTGKRGRPRKYPVDVQMNCLSVGEKNQVNSTNSDTSVYVKDKHYNNVIRKCSRKGRPRKCLRYADINSGVDNESLDGITDTRINSEDCKGEIDSAGKISHSKQILVSEKNAETSSNVGSCSECSNCNNEEAEKLILPLKKRKQMAGYKVSKELCTLHTKSCKCEVEKLEPPKKKSERLSKNSTSDASKGNGSENDTICSSTQRSKLLEQQRNLRSHTATRAQKNAVATTAGKRKKFVDVNENETDFVHPKKSKQSKSSEEDLTAVEEVEESNEKACYNSNYLTLKQSYAEVATPSVLQDYKQMKSSSFVSKFNNVYTVDPISKSFGRNSFAGIVFPSYKPKKSTWHCLLGKEFEEFLPPLKNSVLLKIEKTWLKDETDWFQLNCFDSTPLDVTSNHLTFFAGGPIWSAAWCPTPNVQTTQYIALATGSSVNNYYSYTDTPEEKGLLQLWNVGHLGSVLETKPSMQLGIAHKHGIVWDMAWCPGGCWEDPNSEYSSDDMPCLGLLAVACSNSNIYIYSIPHPESLASFTETAPLYSTSPSAVLHPLFGDPCFGTRKSMCISLCWQKSDAYERIAGGYGNGMICVWLVNSSATIIMKDDLQKAIAPYLVFQAHGTPVLSLAFAALPGNRWLVSSSFDKTLKFWDLLDTSMPFCSLRKGIARCAQWSPQCCGVYASLDDGLSFKGSSLFKECGIEQIPVRCVSANCNPAKKSSVSDWMNAQAIANAAGTVSVNFMQAMYQEHMKYPFYKHYPVFKTEVTVLANCASDEKDISDIVADITEVIAIVEDLIQTAETLCIHFKSQSSSGAENPVCVLESDQWVEKTYMGMNKEDIFDVSEMLSGIMDIVENTVLCDEKKKENDHSFLDNRNVLDTCRWMNSEKIDDMSSVENTVVDIAKTCTSFLKNSLLDVMHTKTVQSPSIGNLSELEGRDSSVSALLENSSDLKSSTLNQEERFDNRHETASSCNIIPLINSNNILNSNDSSLVQTSQHSLSSDVSNVGAPSSESELSDHISEANSSSDVYHGNQLTYIKNSNLGIKFSNDDENFSENETDTDDESDSMSVDRYSLDQSSSFSDDSLLSECSLTSNSSECSSEYDSGVSDISSSPNIEQVPHSVSNEGSSHSVDGQIVLKAVNNEINNKCIRNHEDIPENALPKIHTQTECFISSDEYSKKPSVAVTTKINELSMGIDSYSCDSISGALNDQDSVHTALIKVWQKKSVHVSCKENSELNSVLPKCSESNQNSSVVNTSAESEHLSNLLTTEISVCRTDDTQTDYDLTHSKQSYITDCLPYEKIGTNYGLIFKDMDLSNSAVSSPEVDDDTDSFAFDQFHLASLNTVAWNQNYGCHYYLLSAGSSGIARISCLSRICSENGKSMTSDAHIM